MSVFPGEPLPYAQYRLGLALNETGEEEVYVAVPVGVDGAARTEGIELFASEATARPLHRLIVTTDFGRTCVHFYGKYLVAVSRAELHLAAEFTDPVKKIAADFLRMPFVRSSDSLGVLQSMLRACTAQQQQVEAGFERVRTLKAPGAFWAPREIERQLLVCGACVTALADTVAELATGARCGTLWHLSVAAGRSYRVANDAFLALFASLLGPSA